ncbi:TPA: helix-turn-helix transcriptional regulator [Enterobacter asburiae]|nr:helix-turn-helix transcriptional regulator [Enterobacter kobei]HCW3078563.1 helix-turn-helix transcriptional regulator [Enterobacter asburiae]HCW3088112.1 helix-turn-helix transcriptional regulator [Enterobacter asburiae]HCW3145928.1 helix-turn-helix transcriptional regulator [Enterobacter asburiae]HCW3427962.1 helix-turn-helix transcriptional regulator [Enterobacter asburiae]
MSKAGMSQGMLAKTAGMAQPTIWRIATGKANGSSKILDIAKALNVRPEWLMTGEEPMVAGTTVVKGEPSIPEAREWIGVDTWDNNTPVMSDEVEVPFLKDIEFACGDGRVGDEDYNGYKLRFSKATLRRVGANTDGHGVICFPARGSSMEPAIPDGTTVAINTEDKKIVDGKIYAISEDGWKRIKLLYRTGPDTVSIRSYNSSEFPAEEKPLDNIEILGRVFWYSVLL